MKYDIIERGTWKPVGVVDGVEQYEMDIPEKVINERAKNNENVYLSDFLDELPNGMFCKGATGIGGTSLVLASDQPCIVAFPTRNLTINKMVVRDPVTHKITDQRTDFFCVFGGHNDKISDLERYLKQNGSNPVKICCTYDQTYKLVQNIKELGWHPRKMGLKLVIDEWHQILFDYSSDRIPRLRKMLSLINDPLFKGHVTCMSATPLTREYLFEEMQSLPCYTVNYKPVFPEIIPSKHIYLTKDLQELSKRFLSGIEGTANAHVFMNSVHGIVGVVFDDDIAPNIDKIKIVCSEQDERNTKLFVNGANKYIERMQRRLMANEITENEYNILTRAMKERLERVAKGFPFVDNINDDVRKINFYTATAFCGCDIYDENAIQYIISNGANKYTMHDISTIFVQILGRVRDSRNPQVYHWFTTNRYIQDEQGHCGFLESNILTAEIAKACLAHPQAAIERYSVEELESYYLCKTDDGGLAYDKNLMNKDKLNWEIVHKQHRSSVSVKAEFLKVGIKVAEPLADDYNQTLGREIAKRPTIKTTFKQRFEFYVRLRTDPQLELFQQRPFDIYVMENNDDLLKPAFDIVGVDRVRALKYNVRSIKNEISSFRTGQEQRRGVSAFGLKVGDVIQTSQVKDLEKRAAQKLGVPKVKLTDYFEKSNPLKMSIGGERVNCYRILAVKGKKKT